MANVSVCFGTILRVLTLTSDIVLALLEEISHSVGGDTKFHQLFAMTMKARQCKRWFRPADKGELWDK